MDFFFCLGEGVCGGIGMSREGFFAIDVINNLVLLELGKADETVGCLITAQDRCDKLSALTLDWQWNRFVLLCNTFT